MGDDDTATQEQQHAGWGNTYHEHVPHVRHRAHVPSTDGLIEGFGSTYVNFFFLASNGVSPMEYLLRVMIVWYYVLFIIILCCRAQVTLRPSIVLRRLNRRF